MIDKYAYVIHNGFKIRFIEEPPYPANRIIKERTTVID